MANNRGLYAQVPAAAYGLGAGASSGLSPGVMMGAGGILSGLFGHSDDPYKAAGDQFQKYANMAKDVQNPFLNAGTGAIGNYQEWLKHMSNPSQFFNNLMGQYQESPYAQYQQQQSVRAAQNAASASGMMGSSPMMQQVQQNAQNISSGDMNNWLNHVLGINQQYGAGNQYLMGQGANSANALTNLYSNLGNNMAQMAYGQSAGQNQDFMNLLGGGLSLAGALL